MLPSTLSLTAKDRTIAGHDGAPDGDDVPPRVSNGLHKPATKSNTQAANKYYQVRKSQENIYNYWKN
jgi:hypothetical protein